MSEHENGTCACCQGSIDSRDLQPTERHSCFMYDLIQPECFVAINSHSFKLNLGQFWQFDSCGQHRNTSIGPNEGQIDYIKFIHADESKRKVNLITGTV